MNIYNLKEAIKNLPDDMEVIVEGESEGWVAEVFDTIDNNGDIVPMFNICFENP